MRIADLSTLRVAIWGLGREGHATYTALRQRLPDLPVSVFCSDAEAHFLLADAPSGQAGPFEQNASGDRFITKAPDAGDLSAFDVVIKSPGISSYLPELLEAQHNGTRFTSATAIWFAEHPDARVIAVTGTKGKSTTSALIAHLLRGLGRLTALAGNIGMPVLELLDPPIEPDWWVLELSSFQTRQAANLSLGVITNIEEEHLDWHGNRDRYVSDKLAMADAAQTLLVNGQQAELLQRTSFHPQRICFANAGGWHANATSILRGEQVVFNRAELPLAGLHNALNVCAALAALEAVGEDAIAAAAYLASFRPLPHRLQRLGERGSVAWIDDSIATTPQATIEALRSVASPAVTVIIGGHDRGLDWQGFADFVRANPPHAIIANGANGKRISSVLRAGLGDYRLHCVATLADAIAIARDDTPTGGTILLSPGAPSFDQFHDYAERGRSFAEQAGFNAYAIGLIEGLGIA